MKRSTGLTLLTACVVLVTLSHLDLQSADDSWLLVIDGRPVDVAGHVAERWNHLARDCRQVEHVAAEQPFHARTLQTVREYSPPDSASAEVRRLIRSGDWALADLQFSGLQNAVVLLHETTQGLRILPEAMWSGTTHPLHEASFIRRYMRLRAPEAPADLIRCFDPQP